MPFAVVVALASCGDDSARVVGRDDPASPAPVSATSPADPHAPRIVLQPVSATVAAGAYAVVELRLENVRGEGSTVVTYGDDRGGHNWAAADVGCGVDPGFVQRQELRHAYRTAGTFTVTATFNAAACGGAPRQTYRATTVVEVTPARVPTNGPDQPGVVAFAPHPANKGVVTIDAKAWDEDGYVTEVRYAWGDGGEDSVYPFPLNGCSDAPDRWPATPRPGPPAGEWSSPEHRYTSPGDYRVTVTVVSVGCDGGDRQEATAVVELTDV